MRAARLPLSLSLIALAVCGLSAPFDVAAERTFASYAPRNGLVPMSVEIQSNTGDARGTLRVTLDAYQMDYPVELPASSKKRVEILVPAQWGEVTTQLITNRGVVLAKFPLEFSADNTSFPILHISDSPGQLNFVRSFGATTGRQAPAFRLTDVYCRAELLPERAAAYSGLSAVVLGEGAERLSDSAVEALKAWCLTGGNLVFVGGASSPVLTDSRWRSLVPYQTLRVRNLNAPEATARLGSVGFNEEFTILDAVPKPGARAVVAQSDPLAWEQGYGIGRVIYLEFDPTDGALQRWSGRASMMNRVLRPSEWARTIGFVDRYAQAYDMYATATMPASGGPPTPMATPFGRVEGDPFETQLPKSSSIFWILVGYFVLVVPLNFFILKKMNRSEWTWFTAPVISLGFAAGLFSVAGNLYKASMSTISEGVIIANAGSSQAMFVGSTKLFFPRGGNYDLKLENVDSLAIYDTPDFSAFGGQVAGTSYRDIQPIDDGQIRVPQMVATNLAFREIYYRQRVTADWFRMDVSEPDRSGARMVTVRNQSKHRLTGPRIQAGDRMVALKELAPGETVRAKLPPAAPSTNKRAQAGGDELADITKKRGQVSLYGIVDFRPGPQIGLNLGDRSRVGFVMFQSMDGEGAR